MGLMSKTEKEMNDLWFWAWQLQVYGRGKTLLIPAKCLYLPGREILYIE